MVDLLFYVGKNIKFNNILVFNCLLNACKINDKQN